MAGVAKAQAARSQVKNAGEHRNEQHLGIVARDLGVRAQNDLAYVEFIAQGAAFAQCLADRHEQAGRHALAGDIANRDEQVIVIDLEEIEEIAADMLGRNNFGLEIEARIGQEILRFGQDPHLDAEGRSEFTLHRRRRQLLFFQGASQ